MKLRRRLLPPAFAATIAFISALPILTPWFTERQSNLLSLGIAMVGFFLKALLFSYMRHRMVTTKRKLTIFGQAIVDHWSGIMVFDASMVLVFFTLFLLNFAYRTVHHWLVIVNRSAINGGVALVVATGIAVAWEMHKVREEDILTVHQIELGDEGKEASRQSAPLHEDREGIEYLPTYEEG